MRLGVFSTQLVRSSVHPLRDHRTDSDTGVSVICKILGVPLEAEPTFHTWIYDFLAGMDLGPEGATEEGQARAKKGRAGQTALAQYLGELIEHYLSQPGDGLLSQLVNDDGPDGPMPPAEAVANAQLLLVAGHESTVNTITNCVMTMLRNPGSLDLVRRRPELIPRAIEEVQRLQSAVQFFPPAGAARNRLTTG